MARILTPPSLLQDSNSNMVCFLILPRKALGQLNVLLPTDAGLNEAEQILVPRNWTRRACAPHPIILLGRGKGSLR